MVKKIWIVNLFSGYTSESETIIFECEKEAKKCYDEYFKKSLEVLSEMGDFEDETLFEHFTNSKNFKDYIKEGNNYSEVQWENEGNWYCLRLTEYTIKRC